MRSRSDAPMSAPCNFQSLQLRALKSIPRARLVQTPTGHTGLGHLNTHVLWEPLIAQESSRQLMRRSLPGVGTRSNLPAHAGPSLSNRPQVTVSLNDPHCLLVLRQSRDLQFTTISQTRAERKHRYLPVGRE